MAAEYKDLDTSWCQDPKCDGELIPAFISSRSIGNLSEVDTTLEPPMSPSPKQDHVCWNHFLHIQQLGNKTPPSAYQLIYHTHTEYPWRNPTATIYIPCIIDKLILIVMIWFRGSNYCWQISHLPHRLEFLSLVSNEDISRRCSGHVPRMHSDWKEGFCVCPVVII